MQAATRILDGTVVGSWRNISHRASNRFRLNYWYVLNAHETHATAERAYFLRFPSGQIGGVILILALTREEAIFRFRQVFGSMLPRGVPLKLCRWTKAELPEPKAVF